MQFQWGRGGGGGGGGRGGGGGGGPCEERHVPRAFPTSRALPTRAYKLLQRPTMYGSKSKRRKDFAALYISSYNTTYLSLVSVQHSDRIWLDFRFRRTSLPSPANKQDNDDNQ